MRAKSPLTLLVAVLLATSACLDLEPTEDTIRAPTTTEGETGPVLVFSSDPPSFLGRITLPVSTAGAAPAEATTLDGIPEPVGSAPGPDSPFPQVIGGGPADVGITEPAELLAVAALDIDRVWESRWDAEFPTLPYESPQAVWLYDSSRSEVHPSVCFPQTVDPRLLAENAWYCYGDAVIGFDAVLLLTMYAQFGDFAPVMILAHEWGHHLQNVLLTRPSDTLAIFSVEKELQADCFAGAYVRHAGLSGLFPVSAADLQEAADAIYSIGTEATYGWFESGWHGTPDHRRHAFMSGYEHGSAEACEEWATAWRHLSFSEGPYLLGRLDGSIATERPGGGGEFSGTAYGDSRVQFRSYTVEEAEVQRVAGPLLTAWFGESQDGSALFDNYGTWDIGGDTRGMGIPGEAIMIAYGQTIGGTEYHGYVIVHASGRGHALVIDVFDPGAPPAADSDWSSVLQTALGALHGLAAPGL